MPGWACASFNGLWCSSSLPRTSWLLISAVNPLGPSVSHSTMISQRLLWQNCGESSCKPQTEPQNLQNQKRAISVPESRFKAFQLKNFPRIRPNPSCARTPPKRVCWSCCTWTCWPPVWPSQRKRNGFGICWRPCEQSETGLCGDVGRIFHHKVPENEGFCMDPTVGYRTSTFDSSLLYIYICSDSTMVFGDEHPEIPGG